MCVYAISAYPERYLQVLSSPHVHARVVFPDVVEIFAVDSEQPASHRR